MDNRFFVGASGQNVAFLRPIPQRMSNEDALNLAAWIVAIVDPTRDKFDKAFQAVCGT